MKIQTWVTKYLVQSSSLRRNGDEWRQMTLDIRNNRQRHMKHFCRLRNAVENGKRELRDMIETF